MGIKVGLLDLSYIILEYFLGRTLFIAECRNIDKMIAASGQLCNMQQLPEVNL